MMAGAASGTTMCEAAHNGDTTKEDAAMRAIKDAARMPQGAATFCRARTRTQRALTAILAAALCLSILAVGAATSSADASARQASSKKKSKGFTVKVKSGTMTLVLSSQAWSSINSSAGSAVGTMTTPIAPATSNSTGTLTFPINRGSLNTASGKGTVDAQGGLTIESHLTVAGLFSSSSSASAENPVVSLGKTSEVTLTSQNFTPASVALLTLNIGRIKPSGSRHAVSFSKIPAILTAPGAQFFGSSFHAGEQIGTVTIQIKG
jgi:hypothetical protein